MFPPLNVRTQWPRGFPSEVPKAVSPKCTREKGDAKGNSATRKQNQSEIKREQDLDKESQRKKERETEKRGRKTKKNRKRNRKGKRNKVELKRETGDEEKGQRHLFPANGNNKTLKIAANGRDGGSGRNRETNK